METTKFWSRVGGWLKGSGRTTMDYADDFEPTSAVTESTASVEAVDVPATHMTVSPPAPEPVPPLHVEHVAATQDRLELRRLEDESARVVKLMNTIQEHVAAQAADTDKIRQSLADISAKLSESPDALKKQTELLATIREAVSASAVSSKHLENSLTQLPHLADSQRETMVSLGRQLDVSNETNDRVSSTMDQIQHAVVKLAEATESSTRAAEKLRWDASARDERLAVLIEEQSRRFAAFAWAAIALASVAVALGVGAVLL